MSSHAAKLLRISALAFGLVQLCPTAAMAATDAERIADLERKLEKSLSQIDRLATRLAELEAAKPAAASVTAATPAADARIESLERNLAQITESSARGSSGNLGVPLHGFADVGYTSSGKKAGDGRQRGFGLGNVDFYLTPEFGDRIKSLIELNFEYGDDGSLGTDLERLQVGYTVNDALTLWAGRFHTPYGYWNTAFHHGAQLQTSVQRPRMIAFEDQGGILSAHTVGVWATGQTRAGDGRIEYDAYVGNGGRTLDGVIDYNAVKDDNSNRMVGASVRYRFGGAADGLVLGAHGYAQKISSYANATLNSTAKVNMLGGYAFYDAYDWEAIGEYYHFDNTNLYGGTGSHNSWAGFVQVGRMLGGNTLPFVRLEKAVLSQADTYFSGMNSGRSYTRQAVGVRYDLNPKTALKFEFNRTDESRDGGEKYNEAQVQLAVRF